MSDHHEKEVRPRLPAGLSQQLQQSATSHGLSTNDYLARLLQAPQEVLKPTPGSDRERLTRSLNSLGRSLTLLSGVTAQLVLCMLDRDIQTGGKKS